MKLKNFLACLLYSLSKNTGNAFYEGEEIRIAIDLARDNPESHKIVPIIIDNALESKDLPYGIRSLNYIHLQNRNLSDILTNIEQTLFSSNYEDYNIPFNFPAEFSIRQSLISSLKNNINETLALDKQRTEKFEDVIKQVAYEHLESKNEVYVIYMDLDKFSYINKNYGKLGGDKVIMEIEKIINELASNFYWKRIGQDEFVICVRNRDENFVTNFIEQIRKFIAGYDWIQINETIYLTGSFGYAELLLMETNKESIDILEVIDEWIIRAIHGCLKSKREGGNRWNKGPLVLSKYVKRGYRRYSSGEYEDID